MRLPELLRRTRDLPDLRRPANGALVMNPLKPKQWEAARRTREHLLVAAGAGTGKTTTVVGRILYLLGADVNGERYEAPVALHQIGAITFTNAAAADLKRKLRKGLREAGLRDMTDEVDNARIGTIHSFCGDILREFALRAGRDPRAQVLEEAEASALAMEVARDVLLHELEANRITGLDQLLTAYPVGDVLTWVTRLTADSDRLLRIMESASPHNELELALLDLAQATLTRLSARLDEEGALDFDRMITWTRDLLRRQPSVRRALQRRLHTLILDEFQDVDPVQREIAYLLGEPESGSDKTTRLMLVGDPKQSIYRFRRADVAVWTEVERDFLDRGLGGTVTLEENFRSVAPILAFVDAAIGPELDTPITGAGHQRFEIRYTPVTPTRETPEDDRVVELVVVPNGADGKPHLVEDARKLEAAAVARRARELHDGGVALRDMAVLLAATSSLELYEGAFRRETLPTYALKAEGFYDCREVLDLILALEVIRDPQDVRALFGWLRSPFAGVRDETLLALARPGASLRWDRMDAAVTGESDLLRQASEILREHVALRDRIPTAELIERVIERTGYLAYLALREEDGKQAIANVRKLIRMARQQPEQGVGDFLRMIREARERGDKEGSARLYGEGDNVITITTIHSAKGLEWPVVFWCDVARDPYRDTRTRLMVGRTGIALKDPESDEQSAQWTRLCQEEEDEGGAERKRLWYVAATRAKDRLIVGGFSGKQKKGSPAAAVADHLACMGVPDGGSVEFAGYDARRFSALVHVCPQADEAETELAGGMPSRPEAPGSFPEPLIPLTARQGRPRHSATSLMKFEHCQRRHWFAYVAGLREPEVRFSGSPGTGGGGPSPILRGQIVHDVLERHGEDELDLLLEDAIGRWDPDAPTPEVAEGRAYRKDLREEVSLVASHPEYRKLNELPSARRELSFVHLVHAGPIVEGQIDLAAHADDGIVLLDVKTFQGNGDDALAGAAAEYALQRDAYVAAVEAIGGQPVTRFAFQFSRAGKQLSDGITAERRASAAARFARIFGAVGGPTQSLATNPADCGRCGYRSAGWCRGREAADADS